MANFCFDFVVGIKLAVVEPLCDTVSCLQCHLEPNEMNVMTSRGFIGRLLCARLCACPLGAQQQCAVLMD